jgi:hypothetical protein
MTPAKELGYKVGDTFEVLKDDSEDYGQYYRQYYKKGMIVRLIEDDESSCPKFKAIGNDNCKSLVNEPGCRFISLENVKPYVPQTVPKDLTAKDTLKKYIQTNYPRDTFLKFLVDDV